MDKSSTPPPDPPRTPRHGDPDHSMLEEEPLGWDQAPQDPDDLPLSRHTPPADVEGRHRDPR